MRVGLVFTATALLLAALPLAAQSDPCPKLPVNSGLVWNEVDAGTVYLCRAVRNDGTGDAFSITLTRTPSFKPRSSDRAETSTVAGQSVQWYKSEIAGSNLVVREALVPMADGRTADITVRAADAAGLQRSFGELEKVSFGP